MKEIIKFQILKTIWTSFGREYYTHLWYSDGTEEYKWMSEFTFDWHVKDAVNVSNYR